jgi:hypothetical protein
MIADTEPPFEQRLRAEGAEQRDLDRGGDDAPDIEAAGEGSVNLTEEANQERVSQPLRSELAPQQRAPVLAVNTSKDASDFDMCCHAKVCKGIKLTIRGKAEGGYMRAMECPDDGHHMEAETDEELFKQARQHTYEAHPEAQLTDEQVRAIVVENAYDKRDILAGIDIPPRAAAYMGAGGMPPSSATPEPRQKRQDSVQADEEQKGKKGFVDKIKDNLRRQ